MDKLVRRVTKAYEDYEFHVVFHAVHNFCTVDLSNIYFDVLKDKLYCNTPNDLERKAAQTVLYQLINTLVAMLSPVLAFTSEEIWGYIKKDGQAESVQLLDWPSSNDLYINDELEARMDKILVLREVVTKALEEARVKKVIGHSLGAWVSIYANEEWMPILKKTGQLDKILIVSKVDMAAEETRVADAIALEGVSGLWVKVQAAEGEKCERCWIIDLSVGVNQQHPTLCARCARVVEKLEA
jgi:isoleucyl-tRNA synthetase